MRSALLLLSFALVLLPTAQAASRRTVSGVVYFTNNTPPKGSVLVELYARQAKRPVASQRLEDGWGFEFKGVRAGEYVLKVSWSGVCELRYKVDARGRAKTSLEILADVDCAHHNGELLPAPLSAQ